MFSEKNERLALLIGALLFTIIGLAQLTRVLTGTAVMLGAHTVPIWLSLVVAVIALFMAFWLGGFSRRSAIR